jgi:hypothetical protein
MVRGCRFLIDRAARDATVMPGCERTARVALRLAGNCLKELDRFLAILIDEHAPPSEASPRHGAAAEGDTDSAQAVADQGDGKPLSGGRPAPARDRARPRFRNGPFAGFARHETGP